MHSSSINGITGERFIPESDTIDDITNVRKPRHRTLPQRRETLLDQRDQQELEVIEGYGTELLEERGMIISCLSTLYVLWLQVQNTADKELTPQALILAIEIQQADLQELDREYNMLVDIRYKSKPVLLLKSRN